MTIDELIRRFDSGERNPELLRQLSELAWQEFHDPWESGLNLAETEQPLAATGPEWTPGEEDLEEDEEAAPPFTVDTLLRHLRNNGLAFWECGQHSYTCRYEYDEASDRCCQAFYSLEGKAKDIVCVRWVSDRRVSAEHFIRAFRLCNQWNANWRWPRAFVDIPRKEARDGREVPPASGVLTLDFQLYLAKGVTQGLFDDLVAAAEAASWSFWQLAHKEFNL